MRFRQSRSLRAHIRKSTLPPRPIFKSTRFLESKRKMTAKGSFRLGDKPAWDETDGMIQDKRA